MTLQTPYNVLTVNTGAALVTTWDSDEVPDGGFEVWMSTNGGAYTLLATTLPTIKTYTYPNIGEKYLFKVRVKHLDDNNKSSYVTMWFQAGQTIAYSDASSKTTVPLITPDGFGETVHPSVIDTGVARWNGYRYWMANNPYHNSDAQYEKHCVWASNDGLNWEKPSFVTNPIKGANTEGDPDLYFENGIMYLFSVVWVAPLKTCQLTKSSNGITWTDYEVIYTDPDTPPGSPGIVKVGSTYYMYFYDATDPADRYIRRLSCATVDGTYANEETISLTKVVGSDWGHIDIMFYNNYYYLFVTVNGGCVVARSSDGINFTKDTVLAITRSGTEAQIYRPSPLWVGSQLYVYYSTLDNVNIWSTKRIKTYLM